MSKKTKIILGIILLIILIILAFIFSFSKKDKTYTITFDSKGGNNISDQIITENSKVKRPTDPTKEGYSFICWEYNKKTFDFQTPIKSNIKLVAKWQKIDEKKEMMIIKFDTDGGPTFENQLIEKGTKVDKPTDPTREGYIFKGWTLNGEDYDFTLPVENNLELKAKWEEVPKNTENSSKTTSTNKNNNTNKNSTSNSSSSTSSNSTNNSNNNQKPTDPTPSTPTPKYYTVQFNSNGGSIVSPQTIVEGSKVASPSNPTRSGYTFAGWTLNGTSYNFNQPVTSNITLTANWTQKKYTITATPVDAYSPDRILTVYENGSRISVSAIKYNDGVLLCSGNNTTVSFSDLTGESSFIVVLTDGTVVNATMN